MASPTGIIRTESGRQTYAPDGTTSSNDSDAYTAQMTSMTPTSDLFADERMFRPRDSNLSHASTLTAQSRQHSSEEKPQTLDLDGENDTPASAPVNKDDTTSERDIEKQKPNNDNNQQGEKENEEEEHDPNLITWDGPDDPGNPQNWPAKKKWLTTLMLGIMTFSVTFASSVFSTATGPTAELFGVSTEVMILGTSLFVLGFGGFPFRRNRYFVTFRS